MYTIQVLLYKCTEVKIILVQASCVRVLATHTQSVNGGLHSVNPDQNIVQLVTGELYLWTHCLLLRCSDFVFDLAFFFMYPTCW